jgi:hypothetical protein
VKCELALPSCHDDCTDPVNKDCLDQAKGCEQLAACYWSRRKCGGKPIRLGNGSCLAARKCVADLEGTDSTMVCEHCIDNHFSPATALLYARFEVCSANAMYETNQANRENRPLAGNPASRCDALVAECGNQ